MKRTTVLIAALAVLGTSGCLEEMDPISLVNKFRVMGVQAEPPEVQPGDGTVLRVLYHDPAERRVTVVWLSCLGSFAPGSDAAAAMAGACEPVAPVGITVGVDGEARYVIPSTPTEPGLATDGGVGAVGDDVLVTVVVYLCAGAEPDGGFPPELGQPGGGGVPNMDLDALCQGGDSLVATKAVRISNSDNPNRNPRIDAVLFNDEPASLQEPYPCGGDGGCTSNVNIKASLTEESFQEYENQFGDLQVEDPYISWFVDQGKVADDRSRASEPSESESGTHGYFETKWEPKGSPATKLWLVVHDVRGGASWQTYQIGEDLVGETDAGSHSVPADQ